MLVEEMEETGCCPPESGGRLCSQRERAVSMCPEGRTGIYFKQEELKSEL